MIDHFTFFSLPLSSLTTVKYHDTKTVSARHSVNLFIHRFGTVRNFTSHILFLGLHVNSTFFLAPRSRNPANEGEHKSKSITNYSWLWNIYSFLYFLCRPNIIDTSILMFFFMLFDHSTFEAGRVEEVMERSAMMKNDFSGTYWRDYISELKRFFFKWRKWDFWVMYEMSSSSLSLSMSDINEL